VTLALQSSKATVAFYRATTGTIDSFTVSPKTQPFFIAHSSIKELPQLGEIYTLPLPRPVLSFQRSPFVLREVQVLAVKQQQENGVYQAVVKWTEERGFSHQQLCEQIQTPVTARHPDLGHIEGTLVAVDDLRELAGIQSESFGALLSSVQNDDTATIQTRQPPSVIWVDARTVQPAYHSASIAPEVMSQAARRYQSEQLQHYWALGYQDAVQGDFLINPTTGRSRYGKPEFDAYKAGFLWAEGQEQPALCNLLYQIRSISFQQSQAKNLAPFAVPLADLVVATNQSIKTVKSQLQQLLEQGAVAISEDGLLSREVEAVSRPYVPVDERHYLYYVWKELAASPLSEF
jgi:acetolactate synthase regulatory subunit